MLERDGYIPGVPCWVDTSHPDPEAAASFYGGLFGWEFDDRAAPGGAGPYLVASLGGHDVAGIGPQPDPAPPTAVWNTYVWVESADDAAAKVVEAGGSVVVDPFDVGEAGRMAVVADPSGAVFCLWQAGAHKGAAMVNAPGSWNFSGLNTRDPEGAKDFYGTVFGWEAADDDADLGMWRLPGYGDHLAERDPEVHERMADVGAPEGFADVVAWLTPMTTEQFSDETPPHWSVTFAVDDADAVAEAASDLGGEVLVAPFDTEWTRMTVVRDPQGAVLTASKFTPPE